MTIPDAYSPYEIGVSVLLQRLGKDHARYVEALTLQARLTENLSSTRIHGGTEVASAERSQIVSQLNSLALAALMVSYNELCSSSVVGGSQQDFRPSRVIASQINVQAHSLARSTSQPDLQALQGFQLSSEQAEWLIHLSFADVFARDSIPPPPAVCASRKSLLNDLAKSISQTSWLAIVGGSGTGKTQLARALSLQAASGEVHWISLRDLTAEAARSRLHQQIALWALSCSDRLDMADPRYLGFVSLSRLVEIVSQSLENGRVLVVDNLPDPLHASVLYDELGITARALGSRGARLLTTGQWALPSRLQTDFARELAVITSPPFIEDDVVEMLQLVDAPAYVRTSKVAALILGTTRGHPSLVAATIYWLRKKNWRLRGTELSELLEGDPLRDEMENERRRLAKLLDKKHRAYLYRLSLLDETFDDETARIVAGVHPRIENPGECLDHVAGPWLECLSGHRYQVTPLLRGAGKANLPAALQKSIHKQVAHAYLMQGTVNATEAQFIALHLWQAGDFRMFAALVTNLLLSAKTAAEVAQVEWATWMPSPDLKWPQEFDIGWRIMFRGVQIRALSILGKDSSRLEADLTALLADDQPVDPAAVLFVYGSVAPFTKSISSETALHNTVEAIRGIGKSKIVPKDLRSPFNEETIWLAAVRLQTPEELRHFLAELRQMTDKERERFFASKLAVEGTAHLIDGVWSAEVRKPIDQRHWDTILAFLDEAQKVGSLPGAAPLAVATARAKSIILADYHGRPDDALAVLTVIPDPQEPNLSFLLQYTIGCMHFGAEHYTEALKYLDAATARHGTDFSYYRFDAERRAVIVQSGLRQWQRAKGRCGALIQSAMANPGMLKYDGLEMMGELAWMHWSDGSKRKACGAMYGYTVGLAESEDVVDPRFREAFNKAGHALGWFSSMAASGRPPGSTRSGEAFTPVDAGLFGVRRDKLGSYVPEYGFSKAIILAQLGIFARAVGLHGIAWQVYRQAVALETTDAEKAFLSYSRLELASLATRFGSPSEAISYALEGIKAAKVRVKLHLDGIDALTPSVDVDFIWRSLPPEERQQAERQFLTIVLVPAFANMLAVERSEVEIRTWIKDWDEAIHEHHSLFEDADYWDGAMQFLDRLAIGLVDKQLRKEDLNFPEGDTFQSLWYIVGSRQQNISLLDSLKMHVFAVDYFLRAELLRDHILPGIGAFLHRFWSSIARTRGFAVNNPRLFRDELDRISPRHDTFAAVRVVQSACRAVGAVPPAEIAARFRTALVREN